MICSSWADRNDLASCGCPDADATVMDLALESASEILLVDGPPVPGNMRSHPPTVFGAGWGGVPVGLVVPVVSDPDRW